MKPREKRLRELERRANVRPRQFVPAITVQPGETVAEVLARDGVVPVEGQWPGLIVHQIVVPGSEAAKALMAEKGGNGTDA